MSIETAITVLRDANANWTKKVEAAGELTSSGETPLEYLVDCLKIRGLPAEMAATKLYVRTKRPREDNSITSVVLDFDDWSDYLKRTGLLK